ncbi:MAG: xanthine dehydrogenase molybdenum-binding subunit XdhA [Oscillospiraceae bacterium]|nr:xanthine dehydrogenase molybdenum-binding subunit XdhA [Oscillospiraceae bacterium]
MAEVGKRKPRVDAYDKATGRTKYYEDLMPREALFARIKHSEIAHGMVKSIDTSAAEAIEGVVKVLTCFDVPNIPFPTAGHPWSMEQSHQDVADRLLLNRHVRYYGDDVAVVIAENEVAAVQGVRALKVEYEEFPFVLDVQKAMEDGAPQIHNAYPNNILKHTSLSRGNYEEAIKEPGLIRVEGWYETPSVQHCHIENHGCYAYEENGRIVVVASTQIPHIVRRVVGQALGRPWGEIRIVKPYIGGGFGNKQDALYEPLCAYCSTQVGGRCVRLDCSREETFVSNRLRHAIRYHIISWLRPDGTFAARKLECFSNQGAYSSHGHSIVAKGLGAFPQQYQCANVVGDAYTVFTNRPVAGAMRGYGIPQAMFANESHIDDCAKAVGMDPLAFRHKNLMEVGYEDPFSKNVNYFDSYNQCLAKGKEYIDYDRKIAEYAKETGPIRHGIGVAAFWYNTAVYPIALETSSNRMQLNLDGTVTMQCGETEIGQGADTVFAQMAADVLGLASYRDVNVVSCQDTDITPTGLGAYASRQTYVAGFSIRQTGLLLKEKILKRACDLTRQAPYNIDIVDGNIVRITDGKKLMTLSELAMTAQYDPVNSEHITAEETYTIRNNAYSFGCTFAEVEVDIPMCKVTLTNIVNVHDCGTLINPALAEAQVHGGMSMAIGYGLSEQLLFDEKTGKPLNNNLLDYKLSTFMDHPHLEAQFVENPEPTSAFGTKSLGEPPACSGAPAIRNAIYNATGVAINENPITPHVLFKYFTQEGLIEE